MISTDESSASRRDKASRAPPIRAFNLPNAAQTEYHNKVITKIFKNPYHGCYALAVAIFSLGIFRDALYVYTSNLLTANTKTITATPAPSSTNPPIQKS